MTKKFLALVTVVIDDLIRMMPAIEPLLLQHLLLLTGFVRSFDDLYVLINLITDHGVILMAQLTLKLLLILSFFISGSFYSAIITDNMTTV